jgi:cytochrome b
MKKFKIWDPFVRIFHWSLVIGFTANALVLDEEGKTHIWVGYAIVALIVARILWGFVGSRSARFATFTPNREQVLGQISDIATRRRKTHLGHSPLGALMIFNIIASMLAIGVTGYMMTTNAFWGIEWVEEMHEVFVGWAEISIVLHIAAVIFESIRTGVNLPRSMVTGVKTIPADVILEK